VDEAWQASPASRSRSFRGLQLRQRRGRRPCGAPHVCARAADRGSDSRPKSSRSTSRTWKGTAGAALCQFIGKNQTAYLESYWVCEHADRYVTYADYWIQDHEYRDTDTGEVFDRSSLNAELEKIEKPAGISNPKDFRNEIVNFVLRARANNSGKNPLWTSYEKLRTVIEKKMFSNTEELLPVISFNAKSSADEQKKHEDFVNRMVHKGYTAKQVRLLCEWYLRVRKSS
jgi:serine protein kinase